MPVDKNGREEDMEKLKHTLTQEIFQLLNKSVITYRAASWWGQTDYRCVEILMEKEIFECLEGLLGSINGRIDKQYEGRDTNESIS